MPKIKMTFSFDEEDVKKKAKENGVEFTSILDYASREAGWLEQSGFSLQSVEVIDPNKLPDEIGFWHYKDVLHVAPGLSNDEARQVLDYVQSEHDANVGIVWDTLSDAVEKLFGKKEC